MKICHHRFIEAKEALKLSPSRDIHVELSAKKTCTVENIVLQNHQAGLQLIADTGISTGFIKMILREHLLMTKICAQ